MGDGQRSQSVNNAEVAALTGRFSWTTFDVTSLLPSNWQQEIANVALNQRSSITLKPPHSTSREAPDVETLAILTVRGVVVWEALPWLISLYQGVFRTLAEVHARQPVHLARDKRYAVVMNVQERGSARYECHVDTNPIEGLLYVTSHKDEDDGQLVIANNRVAQNMTEIDADASVLYPQAGHLVFFDGRYHPHYVRPLYKSNLRVAVGMNYYINECPESMRPPDLNEYLYDNR